MLKIRLKRFGKVHRPFYRIVVMQARTKRQGRAVEELGFIDPINKTRKINKERVEYWLSVGAQPTYTVQRYLISEKILSIKDVDTKEFKREPSEKTKQRRAKKAAIKAKGKQAEVKSKNPKIKADSKKVEKQDISDKK